MPVSDNVSPVTAAEKAADLLIDEARAIDVTYAKYFAGSIVVVIAVYTIIHWSRALCNRHHGRTRSKVAQSLLKLSRSSRPLGRGFVVGGKLITLSEILLPMIYFGINLTWIFTNIDISLGTMFAKRCGW